jgi:hypothetical protein
MQNTERVESLIEQADFTLHSEQSSKQ